MNPSIPTQNDPIIGTAGFLSFVAAQKWREAVTPGLAQLSMIPEHYCLMMAIEWLQSRQDMIMQTELATELAMDVMLVSKYLRQLEDLKLVKRLPHAEDGRARNVVLTKAGDSMLKRARTISNEAENLIFGAVQAQNKIVHSLQPQLFQS